MPMRVPSFLRRKSAKSQTSDNQRSSIMANQETTINTQQAKLDTQQVQLQQSGSLTPSREQEIEAYGWQAVPRSNDALLKTGKAFIEAPVFQAQELEQSVPVSELSRQVEAYAKESLPVQTFNHSMRVYLYGLAIANTIFPEWLTPSFIETYYLSALLHDIGTTDINMSSTLLSFEFHGGVTALTLFQSLGAPKAQAEAVAECIIRHQDLGETGTVTRITALILLATLLDNAGANEHLVARGTIEQVVARWPRMKWTGCFAATIRKEVGQKPWAHSTHIDGFTDKIEGNKLMEPYE